MQFLSISEDSGTSIIILGPSVSPQSAFSTESQHCKTELAIQVQEELTHHFDLLGAVLSVASSIRKINFPFVSAEAFFMFVWGVRDQGEAGPAEGVDHQRVVWLRDNCQGALHNISR